VLRDLPHVPSAWLVVPAVLLFYFLALNSLVGDSPTMDEQNHLARGLAFLRTGDPRLSVEHPPLVNAISALPLLLLDDVRLPIDHPSWQQREGWYAFAEQLLWVYNQDVSRMIFLARLPIVWLTLGLALLAYGFARQLWAGRSPALLAFYLLLFEPNVMAHGRYTTTDVGGAFFMMLVLVLLWRLWQPGHAQWRSQLAAGVAVGLAFGSKLSALAFVPVWAVLALLPLYGETVAPANWRQLLLGAGRRLRQLGVAGLIALPVLWLIFGLEWGPLSFQSSELAFLHGRAGPMPTFWSGVEQILLLSRHGRMSAFLLGRFSEDGFLAYFPVAFLVKTPLPVLFLLAAAVMLLLRAPMNRRPALFLLVPALLYFLLSMHSALNIGYRHLLPILPLLAVLIGGLASLRVARREEQVAGGRWQALYALPWTAVLLLVWSAIAIHPHYLSYFNALAGGPANGYRVLVDSNLDWGQDLLRLQAWMAEHEVAQLKLSWFGTADPAYYGVAYEPLPGLPRHFDLWWRVPFNTAAPEPGIYAISATNLWEIPLRPEEKTVFAWFRAREPDHRVGYSILIFEVE
jgi:4-amino-4-deoxy-L-arabinose transferase-like glycosyltransferase